MEFTKSYRLKKKVATQIKLMGVKNDLTAGQVLDALLKMQAASKYLTNPADRALFERVWGQSVLSAKQVGKGGFREMPDPHQAIVETPESDEY